MAPDAQGIALPNMRAVCCLTASLFDPVTYMCMKFSAMFIHTYSIFWN